VGGGSGGGGGAHHDIFAQIIEFCASKFIVLSKHVERFFDFRFLSV
jgi:hypothetical protein